jgi:16S rRNA C1402 N4-methylase RsmH
LRQEIHPIKTRRIKEVLIKYLPEKVRNKILAQIYQAIRIEVNQEMDVLKKFLEQSLNFKTRRPIRCYLISLFRRQIKDLLKRNV